MQPIDIKSIYLSILMALILQMLPWSGVMLMMRPDFVLIAVIYWLLRAPKLCNVGTAWFAGLLIDLINGNVFGQNALAYSITAYFAVLYQRRSILFTFTQQMAYVCILLVLNQTTLSLLKIMSGGVFPGWIYFAPCVSSMLVWILFSVLRMDLRANS